MSQRKTENNKGFIIIVTIPETKTFKKCIFTTFSNEVIVTLY